MGNASFNSLSHGVSLRSSAGNIAASGSIGGSAIFKSPKGGKPPANRINKSGRKEGSEARVHEQAKEREKFDRIKQIEILRDSLQLFDSRVDWDTEILDTDQEIQEPTVEEIAAYCKYVTLSSKMENEIPVIALVYIERLLTKTGVLINKYNWKRFILVCLCVASKVWDDDSLENIHFPKVMREIKLVMLNKLEQAFLDLCLNYDLVVKGSEYAKYYFIMSTLAEEFRNESQMPEEKHVQQNRRKKRDDWAEFPLLAPISADQMAKLQRNAAKAEIYLKDRYELDFI